MVGRFIGTTIPGQPSAAGRETPLVCYFLASFLLRSFTLLSGKRWGGRGRLTTVDRSTAPSAQRETRSVTPPIA